MRVRESKMFEIHTGHNWINTGTIVHVLLKKCLFDQFCYFRLKPWRNCSWTTFKLNIYPPLFAVATHSNCFILLALSNDNDRRATRICSLRDTLAQVWDSHCSFQLQTHPRLPPRQRPAPLGSAWTGRRVSPERGHDGRCKTAGLKEGIAFVVRAKSHHHMLNLFGFH